MNSSSSKIKESISLAIDSGVAMPEWIESHLASDIESKQFRQAAERLSERMKSDASAWVDNYRLQLCHRSRTDSALALNHSKQLPFAQGDARSRSDRFSTASETRSRPARLPSLLALAATMLAVVGFGSWYIANQSLVDSQLSVAGDSTSDNHSGLDNMVASSAHSADNSANERGSRMSDVEKYKVYSIAVGTTIEALDSFNSTMTQSMLGPQLDRLAQELLDAPGTNQQDHSESHIANEPLAGPVELDARQMQLIREFKRTTHYLVHTFPRQALRLE